MPARQAVTPLGDGESPHGSTVFGAHRLADLLKPLGCLALALFVLLFDNGAALRRLAIEFGGSLRRRIAGFDFLADGFERRHTGAVVPGIGFGGVWSRWFVGHAATLLRLAIEIAHHLL